MSRIPVAVLTNGALLYLPEVRQELAAADMVLPSLDAAREETYPPLTGRCRSFPWSRCLRVSRPSAGSTKAKSGWKSCC